MKRQPTGHEVDEAIQALFDKTAGVPDEASMARMLSRAMALPARRRPWWRRILERWPGRLAVAVPAVGVTALVLAVGLEWAPEPAPAPAVAMLTPGINPAERNAGTETTDTRARAAEEGLVPADPLAALDVGFGDDSDDLALLDPPHMAFNADASVWLAVYDEVIQNKISL